MADRTVDRQASDLFSLGANFKAQKSTSNQRSDIVEALDTVGDIQAQTTRDTRTEYEAVYHYVGTDLATDLALKLGRVANDILVDRIVLRFAEKEPVTVEIAGHNHAANAHAVSVTPGEFDGFELGLSELLGSSVAGWDVPADKPFANSSADSDQVALDLTFEAEHTDVQGHDGGHFAGASYRGIVILEATFLGAPTLTPGEGWITEAANDEDGNQDFDRHVRRARKVLTRTTISE